MIVAVRSDHTVRISDLMEQHVAFLAEVPVVIARAARRPWECDPVSGDGDPALDELREDWKLIVEPELRAHCENEIAILEHWKVQLDKIESSRPDSIASLQIQVRKISEMMANRIKVLKKS